MKILLIADCHLCAPLGTHLPKNLAAVRDGEMFETFRRSIADGIGRGCRAVIVAGDLFDGPAVPMRVKNAVCALFETYPDVPFLYVSGNHEKEALTGTLPKNLRVFGTGWGYFDYESVRFLGRSDTAALTYSDMPVSDEKINIAVLHGSWDSEINLRNAAGHGVALFALGHYHSFAVRTLADGAQAVYPGTPEGHGFDETGEKGYVIFDTERRKAEFVPMAKRRYFDIPVDISDVNEEHEIPELVGEALSCVKSGDLCRIRLTGKVREGLSRDPERLRARFSDRYFLFLTEDETVLAPRAADYRFDKSLRGEFLRAVLGAEDLTEKEKHEVADLGLTLLSEGVR
ncbi:MAG: metallophosphoesterase family protein [Clostridia bacterium]|nr:metallophosphoesterase family protein [Clostridia bacterium]